MNERGNECKVVKKEDVGHYWHEDLVHSVGST